MNFQSILCKTCMFVILLLFLANIKTANAQALVQPEVGTITTINAGTDRIINILQDIGEENEEERKKSIPSSNKAKGSEEKTDLQAENDTKDIEVFYPSFEPEPKTDRKNSHTYTIRGFEKDDKNMIMPIKDNESIQENSLKSKSKHKKGNGAKSKIITSVSSGHQKVDTGNGGEIKNKITGVDIGFIRELKTSSGKLSIGGIIDYNHNNYDNRANGIGGDGNSNDLMFGIIAKQSRESGSYYEGSIRMGRAKTEFNTNNYQINGVHYEKSAPVYAGHAKLGKIIKLNEKNNLDVYGVYAFSHQDHIDVSISSNEKYKLDSISSNRLKIGGRLTSKVKNGKIYYGIAYQYEGSAKIKARSNDGRNISATGKGSSGILELGYNISADKNKTLNLDLNASGFAGRQKGFMIQAQIIKSF